jgi:hypothetical protein
VRETERLNRSFGYASVDEHVSSINLRASSIKNFKIKKNNLRYFLPIGRF